MIPYGTFTFFAIAIVVLLPVVCLGFMGKRSYTYNFLSSLLMVVLILHRKNIIFTTIRI